MIQSGVELGFFIRWEGNLHLSIYYYNGNLLGSTILIDWARVCVMVSLLNEI